jgi:hypothetical protein
MIYSINIKHCNICLRAKEQRSNMCLCPPSSWRDGRVSVPCNSSRPCVPTHILLLPPNPTGQDVVRPHHRSASPLVHSCFSLLPFTGVFPHLYPSSKGFLSVCFRGAQPVFRYELSDFSFLNISLEWQVFLNPFTFHLSICLCLGFSLFLFVI